MKEKKTVLIRAYYLAEIDEEELYKDSSLLDKMENEVSKNIYLPADEDVCLEWNCTSTISLEPEIMNCGRCVNCGAWTTDREKEEPIKGLTNGATVDGKLLCDECLPKDHRWAF